MARRLEAEGLLAESDEIDAADHLARLEKARRLYGEIGDLNGVALTYMIEGQIEAAMALFDPVPEAMNKALKIYKANGNELGEAYVYLLRGGYSQVYAGSSKEPLVYLNRALSIFAKLNHKKGQIAVLRSMSGFYARGSVSEKRKAISLLLNGMALYGVAENDKKVPVMAVMDSMRVAELYRELSENGKALHWYLNAVSALDLFTELLRKPLSQQVLTDLELYGDVPPFYVSFLPLFQQVIPADRLDRLVSGSKLVQAKPGSEIAAQDLMISSMEDLRGDVLQKMTEIYLANGEYQAALSTIKKALQSRLPADPKLTGQTDRGSHLQILAQIHRRLGQYALELEALNESLAWYERPEHLSMTMERMQTLFQLGMAYERMSEDSKAIDNYKLVTDEFKDHPNELSGEAHFRLGELYDKLKDRIKARGHLEQALSFYGNAIQDVQDAKKHADYAARIDEIKKQLGQ